MLPLFAQKVEQELTTGNIFTIITVIGGFICTVIVIIMLGYLAQFFRWWIQSISTGAGRARFASGLCRT